MNYDTWKTTEPSEERGNPDWYCPECDKTWDKCKCEGPICTNCGKPFGEHYALRCESGSDASLWEGTK